MPNSRGGVVRPGDGPTPRSSDRVLTLLAAVVDGADAGGHGTTLTQLAEAVGLAPSTTTRQLASLEQAGFVSRTATGYRPGPNLLRLAHRVVGAHPLPVLAQPTIESVAARSGETTYLAIAHDAAHAIYIAAAEGHRTLRVAGWRGRDVPRGRTAVGRALSGSLRPGEAAVGHDTVEEGVTGISAPIIDAGGAVIAALSVLGPTFRLQGQTLEDARAAVIDGARTVSGLLGAARPSD